MKLQHLPNAVEVEGVEEDRRVVARVAVGVVEKAGVVARAAEACHVAGPADRSMAAVAVSGAVDSAAVSLKAAMNQRVLRAAEDRAWEWKPVAPPVRVWGPAAQDDLEWEPTEPLEKKPTVPRGLEPVRAGWADPTAVSECGRVQALVESAWELAAWEVQPVESE